MTNKISAVLGISGVGKTTAISRFVEEVPSTLHVTGSNLIKHATSVIDAERLRTASKRTIDANQEALLREFDVYLRNNPGRNIIFDGHSVIDNGAKLVSVSADVYSQIKPGMFIFLEASPAEILSRRIADTARPRPIRSALELEKHQSISKAMVMKYGKALSVPVCVIDSSDRISFFSTLSTFFRST